MFLFSFLFRHKSQIQMNKFPFLHFIDPEKESKKMIKNQKESVNDINRRGVAMTWLSQFFSKIELFIYFVVF